MMVNIDRDEQLESFCQEYNSFIRNEISQLILFVQEELHYDLQYKARSNNDDIQASFSSPDILLSVRKESDTFHGYEVDEIMVRNGDYKHNKHLITLYIYNIFPEIETPTKEHALSRDIIEARLHKVLSHEFFHAIQHFFAPEECAKYNLERANATSQVMEATADFFAFLWLTKLLAGGSKEIANTRKDLFMGWKCHRHYWWPYAGAKYFVLDEFGYEITEVAELNSFNHDKSVSNFKRVLNLFFAEGTEKSLAEMLRRRLHDLKDLSKGTRIAFGSIDGQSLEWICGEERWDKAMLYCVCDEAWSGKYPDEEAYNTSFFAEAFLPEEKEIIIVCNFEDQRNRLRRVMKLTSLEKITNLYSTRFLDDEIISIWISTGPVKDYIYQKRVPVFMEKIGECTNIKKIRVKEDDQVSLAKDQQIEMVLEAGEHIVELNNDADYRLLHSKPCQELQEFLLCVPFAKCDPKGRVTEWKIEGSVQMQIIDTNAFLIECCLGEGVEYGVELRGILGQRLSPCPLGNIDPEDVSEEDIRELERRACQQINQTMGLKSLRCIGWFFT